MFLKMCKCIDIDKIRTSPYRLACNGMVERYRQTLNSMLGKIVDENQISLTLHQISLTFSMLMTSCVTFVATDEELMSMLHVTLWYDEDENLFETMHFLPNRLMMSNNGV